MCSCRNVPIRACQLPKHLACGAGVGVVARSVQDVLANFRWHSVARWHPLDKKQFTRRELILERCEDVLQDPEDEEVVISFSCESVFTGSSVAENISKCNALVPGSYFSSSFIYVYLVGPYGLAEMHGALRLYLYERRVVIKTLLLLF